MTQRRKSKKTEAEPRRFGPAHLSGGGRCRCLRGCGAVAAPQKVFQTGQNRKAKTKPLRTLPCLRASGGPYGISYLEWASNGFFLGGYLPRRVRANAGKLRGPWAEHGAGAGAALRGCALPKASLFPWSHLCTGVQGQDPGFDPLDILLQEAHGRGLSVEAWLNPYRLRSSAAMPPESGGEQPCQHPPGMGVCSGRRAVSEPGRACSGGLCGAGRGRAFAELRGGRHPL